MTKKISDNESTREMFKQIRALDGLNSLYKMIPFRKNLFPKLEKVSQKISELNEQATILLIPDQFNEAFSSHGWIAYESMNLDVMRQAVQLAKENDLAKAEEFLSDYYDSETLRWKLLRLNGNKDFRKRLRLLELAKEDYLAQRYHAVVPLLLSLIDGIVNDVSKHVGLFAENVNVTAWDCIAAHETGLKTITALFSKGRNKTNEDPILIPYRNGILHGRDLSFDNKIVAAKCWALLFALRDWATALSEGKKDPKPPKAEATWGEIFSSLTENEQNKKLLENWKARTANDLQHLPFEAEPNSMPDGTPEKEVCVFLGLWLKGHYGPMAEMLIDFVKSGYGKRAAAAREEFSRNIPTSFRILDVEDSAAAISIVKVELSFQNGIKKEVMIRTMFRDEENNPLIRGHKKGAWKLFQDGFNSVIWRFDQ